MTALYQDIPDLIRRARPVRSVYAFHPATIARNVMQFRQHFAGRLAWAVKSNPASEIVRTIVAAGVRDYDVASLAEIAQIHAACPDATLHFNHPVKAPEDIRTAWYDYDVRHFVVDCIEEVDKIAAAIAPAELTQALLLVRFIDPRKTRGSEYNFDIKFGALPDDGLQVLHHAHLLGSQTGLAFHPGSQCENPQSYIDLVRCARRIALAAYADHDIAIARLNLGGGWPAHYIGSHNMAAADYFRLVNAALEEVLSGWDPHPDIITEPGRALVANACSLVTRVDLRRDDARLHINDGFYGGLIEQFFVNFMQPVQVYTPDGAPLDMAETQEFTLFGPTCDSLDQLKSRYRLPSSIKTGDYIVFGMMGAYSNACATHFNGIPPAGFTEVERL